MPTPLASAAFAATRPFPAASMTPLAGDTGADVCVVGATFVGLRTAYDLLQNGKSVVVIERAAAISDASPAGAPAAPAAPADPATPSTASALAHAVVGLGGRIHGATDVLTITPAHNMQVVATSGGAIVARVVVLAGAGPHDTHDMLETADGSALPQVRILTTPAPDIASLFKNGGQQRAA